MSNVESWIRHGVEMRRPLLVNESLSQAEKVVIVGGGLSGMCCAYRIALKRPDVEVVLLEKSNRLGGVISTWSEGEWVCDLAVNATRSHPAFWRLIQDLNLSKEFNPSQSKAKSRWILLGGKKHRLSFSSLFKIGPFRLFKAMKKSRKGGVSVADLLPHKSIADALTLGIVNDTSENVDADFLMPAMTKFGPSPPIKNSILKKRINESYPLFIPKKRSIASLDRGMQSLTDALQERLQSMGNVTIQTGHVVESPESTAQEFGIPVQSVIWTASGLEKERHTTELSIFAVGYRSADVADVQHGYGTLIPDDSIPISGILHESDLHHSKRAPKDHRLFRIMVPHKRWNGNEQLILDSIKNLLSKNDPVLFQNLGTRRIPSYPPGYMQDVSNKSPDCTLVGWGISGVSVTHVVDEAERVAEFF